MIERETAVAPASASSGGLCERVAGVPVYYQSDNVTLYHGDCRELAPGLDADLAIADPPYGQTSCAWDRWPDGWLEAARASVTDVAGLWCFGTLRMFMEHAAEFAAAGWHLSQDVAGEDVDVLWKKHNGSSLHNDRFRRVHEQAAFFYPTEAAWADVFKEPQFTNDATARTVRRKGHARHFRDNGSPERYVSHDGGPRLQRSIIECRSMHGKAINPTEKPLPLIVPLLSYACPPGGLVVDLFSGSGAVLEAAERLGLRAVGFEVREDQCESAALRLEQAAAQQDLFPAT